MMNSSWIPGNQAALSFTFDDARATQLSHGVPLLNNYGIKSTFYVMPHNVEKNPQAWQQVLSDGHEIGNHTLTHPCSGNFSYSRSNPLENFSLAQMEDEVLGANSAIQNMLGVTPQTFAYPCGQTFVGRGKNLRSYVPFIAKNFVAGRATSGSGNVPGIFDVHRLHAVGIDRAEFANLKNHIDEAREKKLWLIFYGHEIGDEERRGISLQLLEEVCRYAISFEDLWIDTVESIARLFLRDAG